MIKPRHCQWAVAPTLPPTLSHVVPATQRHQPPVRCRAGMATVRLSPPHGTKLEKVVTVVCCAAAACTRWPGSRPRRGSRTGWKASKAGLQQVHSLVEARHLVLTQAPDMSTWRASPVLSTHARTKAMKTRKQQQERQQQQQVERLQQRQQPEQQRTLGQRASSLPALSPRLDERTSAHRAPCWRQTSSASWVRWV